MGPNVGEGEIIRPGKIGWPSELPVKMGSLYDPLHGGVLFTLGVYG